MDLIWNPPTASRSGGLHNFPSTYFSKVALRVKVPVAGFPASAEGAKVALMSWNLIFPADFEISLKVPPLATQVFAFAPMPSV